MLILVHGAFEPATWYGGPTESTTALARALVRRGVSLRVLTTNANGPAELPVPTSEWVSRSGVEVWYGRRALGGIGSFEWMPALSELGGGVKVVHTALGFSPWILPLIHFCRRRQIRFVFSPRGTVLPEAMIRGERRKRAFFYLVGSALRTMDAVVHATSEEEASSASELISGVDVVTVPNGLEFFEREPGDEEILQRTKTVLFLGRIHPHKRVDLLIRAFAATLDRVGPGMDVRLAIAGEGTREYVDYLRRVAGEAGVAESVRFRGHIGGAEKQDLLRSAYCLCLPSLSENFGLVVAEALREGVPCVVTKKVPWEQLEEKRCGFQVDDTVPAVAEALARLLSLKEGEYCETAHRARAYAEERCSWDGLVPQMLEMYHVYNQDQPFEGCPEASGHRT